MPELAEVEYFRRQWNPGLGQGILAVRLHPEKRIFRRADSRRIESDLPGARLLGSRAHGKQMLFQFSNELWLGIHLGMTGKLFAAPPGYEPGKHDHLALDQKKQTLVFNDMRQFGRVLFHQGPGLPPWWARLPPAIDSKQFTPDHARAFIESHPRLPIKAVLLLQEGFPGIGNWMADEILWRSGVRPDLPAAELDPGQIRTLWRAVRFVSQQSLKKIAPDLSDPPKAWLFHQRWKPGGICPIHKVPLCRGTVGGRTTAWCPGCQG